MKKQLGFLGCLIITSAAFAGTDRSDAPYFGFSSWNTKNSFSQLKLSGIKMNALKNALRLCRLAGKTHCALDNIELHYAQEKYYDENHRDYRYKTKYNAHVRALDDNKEIKNAEQTSYSGESAFTGLERFNYLEDLGVEFSALTKALENCYADGALECSVKKVETIQSNQHYLDSRISEYRYKTSARASVIGFKR